MKSILYLGMDVHKNSYSLCAIYDFTGEVIAETKINADVNLIVKFIESCKSKIDYTDQDDIAVKAGYEAGCLGYSLYWQLTDLGIDCDIMAPTTMYKSAKNKVVKNDRRDAKMICEQLKNNTYKKVYVPQDKDVEVKEFIRMMNSTKESAKVYKQQINALLLRLGKVYPGKSKWTAAHFKWMKELELNGIFRETLDEYLSTLDTLLERIERFQNRLVELSVREDYKEPVANLRAFKGIDTTAAMTLHVEISDFNRFPTANALVAYCGLTPGEQSSGEKNKRTCITKQGNTIVRKTLIECAQALLKGNYKNKTKRIKARQKGLDVKVIDYADKAVERLQKKFNRLMYRGLNRNKAVAAVARELACFVWGMETGNIQ